MEWLPLLYQILEVCVIPLLGVATAFIINFIKIKSKEAQDKIDNDTADKYIAMLADTITACVIATNQTYVEALKTYSWGYDSSFEWANRCVFCGDLVTNGQFHSVKENNYSYKVCDHCYNIYYNNNYFKGNNESFDFSQK